MDVTKRYEVILGGCRQTPRGESWPPQIINSGWGCGGREPPSRGIPRPDWCWCISWGAAGSAVHLLPVSSRASFNRVPGVPGMGVSVSRAWTWACAGCQVFSNPRCHLAF
jgi:hypothetical protein